MRTKNTEEIRSFLLKMGENRELMADQSRGGSEPWVGEFIFSLIKMTGARNLVEVGTYRGYVTCWMALALRELGSGKVSSIEVDPTVEAPRLSRSLKLGEWISFLAGNSRDILKTIQDIDLAFVDGDHTYEGVKADTELIWGRLNPGGFVLIHDCLDTVGCPGISRYLGERFPGRAVIFNTRSHTWFRKTGLALIQK